MKPDEENDQQFDDESFDSSTLSEEERLEGYEDLKIFMRDRMALRTKEQNQKINDLRLKFIEEDLGRK